VHKLLFVSKRTGGYTAAAAESNDGNVQNNAKNFSFGIMLGVTAG
jgi:hypothetical protein